MFCCQVISVGFFYHVDFSSLVPLIYAYIVITHSDYICQVHHCVNSPTTAASFACFFVINLNHPIKMHFIFSFTVFFYSVLTVFENVQGCYPML